MCQICNVRRPVRDFEGYLTESVNGNLQIKHESAITAERV